VVSSYELPEGGAPRSISQFNVRGPLVLHDFAVTSRHMVFSIPPMRAELSRGGASSQSEDDGVLLTMVYDAKVDRSHVAILDAERLADGPVARAWFDHAIPYGFHGVWHARA
jgi:carotenoid cleavage dioxygenase-like enzyme